MAYPYQPPAGFVPLWNGSERHDQPNIDNTFPKAGSYHPEITATSGRDWTNGRYGLPGGKPYAGDYIQDPARPGMMIPNPDANLALINGPYLDALGIEQASSRLEDAKDELRRRYPDAGEPPIEAVYDLLIAEGGLEGRNIVHWPIVAARIAAQTGGDTPAPDVKALQAALAQAQHDLATAQSSVAAFSASRKRAKGIAEDALKQMGATGGGLPINRARAKLTAIVAELD